MPKIDKPAAKTALAEKTAPTKQGATKKAAAVTDNKVPAAVKAARPAKKIGTDSGVKIAAETRTAPSNGSVNLKKQAEESAREKAKKPKLVRDSFTMPEAEYAVLGIVKKQCIKAGFDVKKSELLRVGVALIKNLSQPDLKKALAALPPLKVGRPKTEN